MIFSADLYAPIDVLKTGEIGDVQLVYDKIGKQICVIKQRNLNTLPIYKKLKAVDNRYIPQIFRLIESDGNFFVVEEYIGGQTLSDILKYENFLDEELSAQIFRQICECLKELHAQNIIHRDIKPSNIMLTRDNVIRLIDFSISRMVKENVDTDTEFLGTKGFAPPEQYGFGQTDSRSDIYSLGITIKTILGKNYEGWLKEILTHCTKLDPEDRYQSVDELIDDFDRRYWQQKFNQMKNFAQIETNSTDEDLTIYEKFTELSRLFADIGAVAENYIDADKDSIQKRLLEQSLTKITEDVEEICHSITEEDFQDLSSKELESAEIGLAELRANLEKFLTDLEKDK